MNNHANDPVDERLWLALKGLNILLQHHVECARLGIMNDDADPWFAAYEKVFNPKMSGQIKNTLSQMNNSLDYWDPDTTYQEDVLVYACAVQEKVDSIQASIDAGYTYSPS